MEGQRRPSIGIRLVIKGTNRCIVISNESRLQNDIDIWYPRERRSSPGTQYAACPYEAAMATITRKTYIIFPLSHHKPQIVTTLFFFTLHLDASQGQKKKRGYGPGHVTIPNKHFPIPSPPPTFPCPTLRQSAQISPLPTHQKDKTE